MNLRQGKIGLQESLCTVAVSASVSSIFTPESAMLYGNGSTAYISMPISALIAFFVFFVLALAIKKSGSSNFNDMLVKSLGKVLGRPTALLYIVILLFMAAMIISRFTLMLDKFIFPNAPEWKILIYLLLGAAIPAWLGFEAIGRAAKLIIGVLALSIIAALFFASYNYEPSRLAPYLGGGVMNILSVGVSGSMLFLPALICALVLAKGMHGIKFASRTGCFATIISGALTSVCELCLGMTYSYKELRDMHSPMYRLTMGAKGGGYFLRLDTLLYFGWVISSMLASGFYIYTASFLFTEAFKLKDIRPACAAFSIITLALALAMNIIPDYFSSIVSSFFRYGFIVVSIPALIAAIICFFKNGEGEHVNG